MPAFVEVLKQHPRAHLVILGLTQEPYRGVDQQKALRRMLHQHPPAQQQLHFPGRVGNMTDWYRSATLFLLPSRYEGFPNVLLEAMTECCCCIAADCPHGPSDLLRHDVDGLLLPMKTGSRQWADCLVQLLQDPPRRDRLQRQAATVRQRFSDAALEQQLVQSLERLH